jgi:fermentation-respiration switch protein FrsA (DUF1100 family)
MVGRANFLRDAGFAVLLVDLQATGESGGSRITFGWREREDVLAATNFIQRMLPQRPVAVLGTSLGGAAAILATPQLKVDAMIVESVYPTIEEAIRNRLAIRLGPAGPMVAPLLLLQLRRLGLQPSQLHPIDKISQAHCPLFVVGGTRDRHTTPAETRRLFEAATAPKQLWLVPNAAHVDLHRYAGREYERRVLAFLGASFAESAATQ